MFHLQGMWIPDEQSFIQFEPTRLFIFASFKKKYFSFFLVGYRALPVSASGKALQRPKSNAVSRYSYSHRPYIYHHICWCIIVVDGF
jgi:hypothetical protein